MADDADDGQEAAGLARGRSRRSQPNKNIRLSALEKYKAARSGQVANKFEVEELKNVYDIVDESDYSRRVQDRQKDDWIIDDGTGEYFEDGREIFDDDLFDDDEESKNSRKKPKSKKDKEDKKLKNEINKSGFQDLRNMLSSMPAKRKLVETDGPSTSKISEDELLSNLMEELHEDKKPKHNNSSSSKRFGTRLSIIPKREPKEMDDASINDLLEEMNRPLKKIKKSKRVYDDIDDSAYSSSTSDRHQDEWNNANNPIEIEIEEKMDFVEPEVPPPHSTSSKSLTTTTERSASTANNVKLFGEQKKPNYYNSSVIEEFESPIITKCEPYEVDEALNDLLMEEADSADSKKLNFYLLDVHEEPKNPGCLYLFGKVQASVGQFVSCCIIVKNLTRCIYLLPREREDDSSEEKYSCDAVLQEFDDVISPKFRISSFKSRPVTKKYCFDAPNVPKLSEYLEVRYSAALPSLPSDLQGETFSRIFGTGVNSLEIFLLEKKLKGPSWLQFINPVEVENEQHQSWCRFEFTCDVRTVRHHPDNASLSPPPLILVSLNILTVNNASTKRDDIVFVGLATNKTFCLQSAVPSNIDCQDSFCLINKPPGEIWPLDIDKVASKRIMKMDSERALLGCLLAKLQQIDADIFLGHDMNFEMLLVHLLDCKVPHWARIGRLKRSTHISKNNKFIDVKTALTGRLVCDIKISAMELIRARSYDFQSLAMQVLGKKDDEVVSFTGPEIKQFFDSSSGIRTFCGWGMKQCRYNLEIANKLQIMPLALQITNIAGNTFPRTLLGGRSERNEFLLLHAFHSKDYIVPDKQPKQFLKKGKVIEAKKEPEREDDDADEGTGGAKSADADTKGPSYVGGLVLAPKRGFYDNFIVLMDFNSLYPSIIQEYNICFTTNVSIDGCEIEEKERGILPEEIRKLVESRKQVKNLMKADNIKLDLMEQYDIRQKALKLTANSMYGCLGFRNSRFYAKELAAMITGKGREILMKTKDVVEKLGFEVIYGDTDSIMINSCTTDVQKVYQIGNKIKSEINRMYRLLELEIDGIFRFMLLLKKKKYAALIYSVKPNGEVETTLEMKGLDMVRRDWAPVAANTARLILDEIMTEQALDDKIFKICKILNEVSSKLREGNIALKQLLITKQLTKNPTEYKSAQGLYHVQVALNMNKSGNLAKKFRNGDTVSYMFCNDGNPHHLSELGVNKKDEDESSDKKILRPDPEYYLAQQVHPVVARICDPIPGLDPARIADALGMDSSSYKRRRVIDDEEDRSLGEQTEAEKYRDCEKFTFKCSNAECRADIVFEDFFKEPVIGESTTLFRCTKCSTSQSKFYMLNNLVLFIRKFVALYYKNVYVCEEPNCTNTQRGLPFRLTRGFPLCACKNGYMFKEYGDSQLYKQLNYLQITFDREKQLKNTVKGEPSNLEFDSTMDTLKWEVTKNLQKSGYSEIKLCTLFQDLYPCDIKLGKSLQKK